MNKAHLQEEILMANFQVSNNSVLVFWWYFSTLSFLTFFHLLKLLLFTRHDMLCWSKNSSRSRILPREWVYFRLRMESCLQSPFHFHLLHVAYTCSLESSWRIIGTYSNFFFSQSVNLGAQIIFVNIFRIWRSCPGNIQVWHFGFLLFYGFKRQGQEMAGIIDIRKNDKDVKLSVNDKTLVILSSEIICVKVIH